MSLLLDAVTALKRCEDHFTRKKKASEFYIDLSGRAMKIRRVSGGGGGTDEEEAVAAAAAVDAHNMDISIVSTGLRQLLEQITMDADPSSVPVFASFWSRSRWMLISERPSFK